MNKELSIAKPLHGQVVGPHTERTAPARESAPVDCSAAEKGPIVPAVDDERNFHAAILASLAEGVHLTRTLDGVIVYTNPRFDRMFGYGPGELIGLSVSVLNAPLADKSPGETAQEIIRTLHEKGAWSGEIQNLTKQGKVIWCRATVSVGSHPVHGQVWISTHEDITESKQAESALEAKERQLRLVTDHVPALIGYVDASLRYRFVNRAYERFFGRPCAQIVGHSVRDVMGEELFGVIQERMTQALAGRAASFEVNQVVQGSPMYLAVEYVPDIDDKGDCNGIYVMVSDVSRRKRAEETIRQSEERLRTILQTAMDGFWRMDTQGRLLEVNDTYCLMSGYTAQELAKMTVADLESGPNDQRIWTHIQKPTMRKEERFESWHRRKDGSVFCVEVSIQYRPEEGGQFVAFLRDISERNAAQEERTRLENQLRQSRKMEAVGQLAGGIAHDFNNILTAIIFQTEMLENEQRNYLDTPSSVLQELRSSVFRAADLTKQLLLFSRQQPIKTSRYNANMIIREVTKLLNRLLGEHVTLGVSCCEEPLWIDGDVSMFEQVVTNLCLNARDAMPMGGELAIEVYPVSCDAEAVRGYGGVAPGPFVCLRVADNGIGMSPATQERIFEPFFTTKPLGKGTGLGLATVHGIVARHRGFIEVTSQLGKGSTFSVYLPRAAPAETRAEPPASAKSRGGAERILLVEDDVTVRKAAAAFLSQLGYRVVEAASGVESIAIWKKARGAFDLLLTDMVMPGGLSGLELSARLRKERASLRTIIASGYHDDPSGSATVWPKDVTYLPKPFTSADLAAAVRSCLDRKA